MPDLETGVNADDNTNETGLIDDAAGRDVIKTALAKIAKKQERIRRFNKYYSGDHPFNFSSEKFTTEFAERLHRFRDNVCPTVVKAPADRLEVIGFSTDKKAEIYKSSWDAWKYSQMPRLAKRVHRDAFRTGDAFVVVWQDENDRSRIYPQDPRNCTVFYNGETGNVDSGAKVWRGNDKFIYLTLYYPDRIEKYISKSTQSAGNIPTTAAAFKKRIVADEPWPLPNDLNVPALFHFGLEDSILTDVIPLNDALNKSVADLLVSSEANSLRQRWAAGIAFETNPETGKQIIPFEAASQWFATQDPTGKFGQFAEGDLKNYLESADHFVTRIASVSGVPKYYFDLEGGTMPSGEALRKAESRFTALIKDAQIDFGETWGRVVKFALEMDGTKVPDDGQFETQWSPADPLSENEKLDAAGKKKGLGVSQERILSELGYTDEDIAAMDVQTQKRLTADAERQATAFSKTFNAGPTLGS